MRTYDWDQHPLGPPRQWPESLRTGVRMMLHSGYPMFIWWSADLYMFHNDAYAPTLVGRHGEALGAKARQVWADVWGQLGGVVEDILAKGTTFYAEDMLVIPERKGFKEETYWTFSYSPMPDDAGKVNGIFCACSDVTAKVLSQRRLNALHQLSEGSHSGQTVEHVCAHTVQVLEKQPSDVPFSALYLMDPSAQRFILKGQTGRGQRLPPHVSLPAERGGNGPLGQSLRAQERSLPDHVLAQLELEATGDSARPKAVVLPLWGAADQPQLLGVLVAGVSPMLEYNQADRDFHQLLARHLGTALQGVASREQRRRQADLLGAILDGAPSSIASFTPLRDATG
ncbi:MAG TPA: PAS domain-containing protein, partial [Cytophagales bacterium]